MTTTKRRSRHGPASYMMAMMLASMMMIIPSASSFAMPTTSLIPSRSIITSERFQQQRMNEMNDLNTPSSSSTRLHSSNKDEFDLDTALFCAGLAFDAYTEPPPDSSRWERGSKGMNVAFLSNAYTRNLYK
eukprot:CAMPEP_0119568144 /NCGR_PEP_ID=MMETSP1352-20130426/38021_1 /TAXON_ID=265584 /ORGANISM="Stauroneis constricta, Strain CCMP1120" /LENGTH=130 /DNA_ID=CAMNT_0007617491 /DNA_START=107 /DNA_END=496 /DNA_ORIENTATION=-